MCGWIIASSRGFKGMFTGSRVNPAVNIINLQEYNMDVILHVVGGRTRTPLVLTIGSSWRQIPLVALLLLSILWIGAAGIASELSENGS